MMEIAGWQHASSTRENNEVTMRSNGWQQVADRRSGDEFELTFAPPAPERDAEREMSLRDTLNSEARVRPSAPGRSTGCLRSALTSDSEGPPLDSPTAHG